MSLERDAAMYRAEQMEEMGTRKATIAEAAAAGEDAMGQLRAVLATHWTRVVDLLREWDEDGNGVVSRREFLRALPVLGIKVDRAEGEELFATFDSDGSGTVSLKELNRKLRIGATIELDSRLQDGGAGEIVLESKNKVALREGLQDGVSSLVGVALDASSDVPIIEQLAVALSSNLGRVVDVFREWDDDANGRISRREFRQALPLLGLRAVSRAEADELFDSLDRDRSGELEYAELHAKLRKRVDPEEVARIRREKERAQRDARERQRATMVKVPPWWRHSWPPEAHESAFEGSRQLYALGGGAQHLRSPRAGLTLMRSHAQGADFAASDPPGAPRPRRRSSSAAARARRRSSTR